MMGPFLMGIGIMLSASAPSTAATPSSPEFATSAGRSDCTTTSDPAKTIVTCTGNLIGTDGRLRSISSTENGISTSAIRNPTAYSSPWSYQTATSDANKAWRSLINAVGSLPDCQIVTVRSSSPDNYYLHATVPTRGGLPSNLGVVDGDAAVLLDDLEFILRTDESLVLYRSASRTSVFIYPLTRPVGDGGYHRRRLNALRATLGWIEIQ
jgi:uncharacterized protein (DUF1499 family)